MSDEWLDKALAVTLVMLGIGLILVAIALVILVTKLP